MRQRHLAVVGFGTLGRACIRAVQFDEQSVLAGVVRQAEHVGLEPAAGYGDIPMVSHISELDHVDAALVCVPTEEVEGVVRALLQHGTPVVECATLHEEDFKRHKEAIDRMCRRYKVPAVVGAGWDPGALSLLRNMFGLLIPRGHSETSLRPGISLHHTQLAQSIHGVQGALSTEVRGEAGVTQHYVYIELAHGADATTVKEQIRSDPLFLEQETFVFVVDDIAALEEQGHGILLQRHGSAGPVEHQMLLLEGRFSDTAMAAQVMVSAARALQTRGDRAYSLMDLPLGILWGELQAASVARWM